MKRIVPGLLISGFWLLLLLKGSILMFLLVLGGIVLLASNEYLRMVDGRSVSTIEKGALNLIIALPVIAVCFHSSVHTLPAAVAASFFCLTAYLLYRYKDSSDSYQLFCRLALGILYIGFLGAHLVLLRFLPEGGSWLIIGSAITAASDSGAYFVGRAFGKKKLCPSVSPNKTVEGALGGVVAGLIAAVAFYYILSVSCSLLFLILSAVFLSGVGIVGDLTESIIKRGTNTKDSGTILAGHGGILDRVDSLLFVAPTLYYLLALAAI